MKNILILAVAVATSLAFADNSVTEKEVRQWEDALENGTSNAKETIVKLSSLSEKGQTSATASLAAIYLYGLGVDVDGKQAFMFAKKAAEQKDSRGEILLGECYQYGTGVESNLTEAVKWYKKSAEHGRLAAQVRLGVMYEDGLGVKQDMSTAAKWYLKAAQKGSCDGQYSIADMYENGKGVKKDIKKAIEWYEKAAKQDDARSLLALGNLYYNGEKVEQSDTKALTYYDAAAKLGDERAKKYADETRKLINGNKTAQPTFATTKQRQFSDDEKKYVDACAYRNVKIGMTYQEAVKMLGAAAVEHKKWRHEAIDGGDGEINPDTFNGRFIELIVRNAEGQTEFEVFIKDDRVVGVSRGPGKVLAPTYKYKFASSGEKSVWVCGKLITVYGRDLVWPTEGTHDIYGIENRLPSSFFALEGMRLGMTARETQFITDFVWQFREDSTNPYAKLPKYAETPIGKLFPNITVKWGQYDQDAYRADGIKPIDVSHYFGVAYEITRHYDKSESKKVGGFEGLKTRLEKKLACSPCKTIPKLSLNTLNKPLAKKMVFDKRYDPWAIWELPEKDLRVELREIHCYSDDDKPHDTRCDMIITSLSIEAAKKAGSKVAASEESAGF